MALVLTMVGQASADPDPDPVDAATQYERNLIDGKLDSEHLERKAAKEAEEDALGLSGESGELVPTLRVWRSGKLYFSAAESAPTTAEAAGNNLCAYGQICLYYNSGLKNANFPRTGMAAQIPDYAGYTFNNGSGLPGYGQAVKNNAASIMNGYEGQPSFGVFYNSNYKGDRGWFVAGDGRDLPDYLKNENASGRF
ncbi:hypothetical protein ACFU96_30935 [Streptomyces sp. NPDC057620]|uniref:hypothetical protein n=1 Tax=Streptomyces sp. NPDC057620 TaxID=3346185 RepID=UPI00368F71E9